MNKMSIQLVNQIAELAKLEISENEKENLVQQLSKVINYVEQLKELDVTDVTPMRHPCDLGTPLREDESNSSSQFLMWLQEEHKDGYKVPPVL